jgi:hypothetical protein
MISRSAPIIAALLLTACVTARVPPKVASPPAKYQQAAAAILKTMSPAEVTKACTEPGAIKPSEALMCAKGAFIFAPYPWLYPDDPYAVALWHELAHVLGWPADHPD